jgi:hypothetical protein
MRNVPVPAGTEVFEFDDIISFRHTAEAGVASVCPGRTWV